MAIGIKVYDEPIDLTGMIQYDGNPAPLISGYTDEVVLLSFIHIDYYNASNHWMNNLINIQSEVNIIVIIFDNLGSVNQFSGVTPPTGCLFPLVLNGDWSGSLAETYLQGFYVSNDPDFHGTPSTEKGRRARSAGHGHRYPHPMDSSVCRSGGSGDTVGRSGR